MLADYTILRTPGPTPIPPRVNRALTQPMIGHRAEDFNQLMQTIKPKLKPIFGTKEDVIILTGSGTSALETAVANTLDEGDEVLILVTGAFGQRFVNIAKSYRLHPHIIEPDWGQAVDVEDVGTYLKTHPKIKTVLATYCETSTGVLNPIQALAQTVRDHSDALFIVDGVSCIGAVDVQMDWGIDILVTGSQKALMLPTGLAFLAVSERAWSTIEANRTSKFYFDLKRYRKSLDDDTTPFTPALSLIMGLDEVLNMLAEEGFEQVIHRHVLMKQMTRAACEALNIPLLTTETDASPTVTAIQPTTFQADELRKWLKKELALSFAGGQGKLAGQIIRLGHMGYCSPLDVLQMMAALELGMKQLGVSFTFGAGVAAAQEVYLNDLQHSRE